MSCYCVSKTDGLPLDEVKTFLLETLKKYLYLLAKVIESRNKLTMDTKLSFCWTNEYNKSSFQ